MATQLRTEVRDGKMYYIIGAKDVNDKLVVICNTIAERNQMSMDGFVIVLHAYMDDPTVNSGWAMYTRVVNGTTVSWMKVMEQESMKGVDEIQQQFLDQFALKGTVTSLQNTVNTISTTLAAVKEIVDGIIVHNHENLDTVLNKLSYTFGHLQFDNRLLTNTFVYDGRRSDGKYVWKNPTYSAAEEEEVDTADDIVEAYISDCAFAAINQDLYITNRDGSVCHYRTFLDDSEEIGYQFMGSVGGEIFPDQETVRYVTKLPEASLMYVWMGCFYLLPPAECGHAANRFYRCLGYGGNYSWTDVTPDEMLGLNGPKFTTCYRSGWNTVKMTWEDPAEVQTEAGCIRTFGKTIVVRKFGSKPLNETDGVVVLETSVRNQYKDTAFIDVCPFSTEKVYYSIFSKTNSGNLYKIREDEKDIAEAKFLDWSTIADACTDGTILKIVSVGDILVFPVNTLTNRSLDVMITKIDTTTKKLYLTSMDSIGDYIFDASEYALTPTEDTTCVTGKHYFVKDLDNGGFKEVDSDDLGGSTPKNLNWFEGTINGTAIQYNETYIGGVEHGNTTWVGSNLRQWLNQNKSTGWFTARDTRDKNGIDSVKSYLNGFDSTFVNLFSEVTLPNAGANSSTALTETNYPLWMLGTDGKARIYTHGATDSVVTTNAPEEAKAVHPVFILPYSV